MFDYEKSSMNALWVFFLIFSIAMEKMKILTGPEDKIQHIYSGKI